MQVAQSGASSVRVVTRFRPANAHQQTNAILLPQHLGESNYSRFRWRKFDIREPDAVFVTEEEDLPTNANQLTHSNQLAHSNSLTHSNPLTHSNSSNLIPSRTQTNRSPSKLRPGEPSPASSSKLGANTNTGLSPPGSANTSPARRRSISVSAASGRVNATNEPRKFYFDRVFGPKSHQTDVRHTTLQHNTKQYNTIQYKTTLNYTTTLHYTISID